MKNKLFYILSILVFVTIASCSLFSKKDKEPVEDMNNTGAKFEIKNLPIGADYADLWEEVKKTENKGLYQSSLNTVDTIYKKALTDNNTNQIVKSVIHQMKYNKRLKEDDYVLAVDNLKSLVKTAESPQKEIINSLLAQVYWGYYQSNRWKFYNRTAIQDTKPEDIRTWSLRDIVKETHNHYNQSLLNQEITQELNIFSFTDILVIGKENENLRPTLYDFLAHRAIDFYKNTEPDITKPAYSFKLNQDEIFSLGDEFLSIRLDQNDSLAGKRKAFEIIQELVDFHKTKTKNISTLIDVQLEQLTFGKNNSILSNKDSLYINSLNSLASKYPDNNHTAEVLFYIASYELSLASKYKPLFKDEVDNKYRWKKKKAVAICNRAIATYPNSYGAKQCRALIQSITSKSLTFNTEDVLVPGKVSKGFVSVTNVSDVYFKVIAVDYDKEKARKSTKREDLIDYYNTKKTLKEWSITIDNGGDYLTKNAHFQIPALPKGYYILLTSASPNFTYDSSSVSFAPFWVSDIAFVKRNNTNNEIEFSVLNRTSGEPINRVKAKAYTEKYNYTLSKYVKKSIGTFYTNGEGYFKIPSTKDYRSVYVDFSKDDDRLNTNDRFYQSRNYNDNKNKKTLAAYLFTDRAIYRPGQTIFFKGISLERIGNKANTLANKNVKVEYYDVNYQLVKSQSLKTNQYGSVSGEFNIPQGLLNGNMTLRLKINGKNYGYKSIRVEEYKRPKFEVGFNPVKGSFKLNQEIKVDGFAKAFAGNVIDGAKVKYTVTRNASFPWWCWYYYRYTPSSNSMEITQGETITDEEGNFEVNFKALADESVNPKYSPTYNYSITADVIDLNGETRSSTQYVYVGYKALAMNLAVAGMIDKNNKHEYVINTSNLNGQRVATNGQIKLYRLIEPTKLMRSEKLSKANYFLTSRAEHDKLFPHDVYHQENDKSTWKRELINTYSFATSKIDSVITKVNMPVLSSAKSGYYLVELLAKDEYGTNVKDVQEFKLFDKQSTQVQFNEYQFIYPIKSSGEPGEVAKFLIGSAAQNCKVLFEVEHLGKIVKKDWITVSNEQKTIEIPIKEMHRGNFGIHFTYIKDNRPYVSSHTISVPFTNKTLDVSFETFRDKLYPGQAEEWKIKIKGANGERIAAEFLATMYDASLDEFAPNYLGMWIYNANYSRLGWSSQGGFGTNYAQTEANNWNKPYAYFKNRIYNSLNLFGLNFGFNSYGGSVYKRSRSSDSYDISANMTYAVEESESLDDETIATGNAKSAPAPVVEQDKKVVSRNQNKEENQSSGKKDYDEFRPFRGNVFQTNILSDVQARTNFNETAFFLPQLTTNSKGEISFKFTVPESLTKWKFMGLAHTKDLKVGTISKNIITQKDLMVVPNTPRFLREGDKLTISSKISNISDKELKGSAQLFLLDAFSMKPIDGLFKNINATQSFTTKAKQSTNVSWDIEVPFGVSSVTYKIVAAAGNFTDGEQKALPILTNRMLVTESMPLPIKKAGNKVFTFDKLLNSTTTGSLAHHKLTLEYTSNPAWYVVQAMPYMMEYPYECAEQTFTRYYANSLATHIMNSNPKIKAIIKQWENYSPEAFLSNLEKNQELKAVLLEETPWVMEAKDESARKKRIAQLFDLGKMSLELNKSKKKLSKMQVSNGAWPWFKGGRENRYITQHIVTGMGHLDHLKVEDVRKDKSTWNMVKSAINFLDKQMLKDYEYIKKYHSNYKTTNHLSNLNIQYLYGRSFFKDVNMDSETKEAFDYFLSQSQTYWLNYNQYAKGMIALANNRWSTSKSSITAQNEITASLKETAIKHEELGMYWKGMMDGGYYWYQAPIETQALMIELFKDVANDDETVEELKVWLLKQKQTTDWKTTKANAEACYALLLDGVDLLASDEKVGIKVGKYTIDYTDSKKDKYSKKVKAEAGTGYIKTTWEGAEVTPDMGKVTLTKKANGVAWGSLYWQYFEDLDKITAHETPLKLKKQLFKKEKTATGDKLIPITGVNPLNVGDKVIVRVELRVDRNMEYVHMKDMRASGFEPINVISRYKWQDGLGYYETTKDASTNFFFDYLPRGTYVFEYPIRVAQKGDFSNGITSIQCMYAPEFASHSEGIRVQVK